MSVWTSCGVGGALGSCRGGCGDLVVVMEPADAHFSHQVHLMLGLFGLLFRTCSAPVLGLSAEHNTRRTI